MTTDAQTEKLTDKEFLGLTVPFMLSTMTQPLMGAVNTAVMGQLPDPKYIAAVSLGAILFNNLYWLFGFLRVSTTGYAAQAHGAADRRLGMQAFFKPLVLAIIVSLACILLQKPIVDCYLGMIGAANDVNELCRKYYWLAHGADQSAGQRLHAGVHECAQYGFEHLFCLHPAYGYYGCGHRYVAQSNLWRRARSIPHLSLRRF